MRNLIAQYFMLLALPIMPAAAPAPATSPSADAQVTAASEAAKTRGDTRSEWLQRAIRVTAAIQDDEFRLPRREQLILPGRLAALWWKSDPKRARLWLENAITHVEFAPNQESDDDLKARLGAARVLLTIAVPLDRGLGERALKVVTEAAEKQRERLSSSDRMKMAGDVVTAAREVAENDPDRALDIARQLLKMKAGGVHIESAYLNLQDASPERARQFLLEAIAATRAEYDPGMVEALAYTLDEFDKQPASAPQGLRPAILGVIAEAMLRPAQSEDDQKSICRTSITASRLLSKFPPDVAGPVRAAIEWCKSRVTPLIGRTVDFELSGKANRTPDELMRAAADESDASIRGILKVQAAMKLEMTDAIRAVDILDSITAEERKKLAINTRPVVAQRALDAAYKAHDTIAMQRILDHTPDEERPQALINVSSMAFRAKDEPLGLAFLGQARAALEKWEPQDNWRPFLTLLNLYAEHMPGEATHVMAEAVIGINRAKPHDPKKPGMIIPTLGDELRVTDLNLAVLDADPEYVAAAIKQVDDLAGRAVLHLALVRACLRRYEAPFPRSKPNPTARPAAKAAVTEKK